MHHNRNMDNATEENGHGQGHGHGATTVAVTVSGDELGAGGGEKTSQPEQKGLSPVSKVG